MFGCDIRELLPVNGSRLHERKNSRKVFRSSNTQGDRCEMNGSNDTKWFSFKVDYLRLFHSLTSEAAEHRDELNRPFSDANRFTFCIVTSTFAECINLLKDIKPGGFRQKDEHIGIQGGNRLGVTHLRNGTKQRVIRNDTLVSHRV